MISIMVISVIQIVNASFIGEGNKEWRFEYKKVDELVASIEIFDDNRFCFTPISINKFITDAKSYTWKFELNYTDKKRQLTNEKLRLSNEKSDLNRPVCFTIDPNINEFKVTFGETSTEIDASATTTATAFSPNQNLCKDSTGKLHVAYEGGASDLWYANSTDDGTTWTTVELLAGTVQDVGILCYANDTLMVYFTESGGDDIDGFTSSDSGDTWSSQLTLADIANMLIYPSCKLDKNDEVHCVAKDESSDLAYYFNSTAWDTEVAVNANSGDDTDVVDIAIDDTCPYVVGMGTDGDDLDIWSPCINGWGDTNRVEIYDGVTFGTDDTLKIKIDEDKVHVVSINGSVLVYSNSSLSHMSSWTSQPIHTGGFNNPDITVHNNEIDIFYTSSNGCGSGNDIHRANSTDGTNWNLTVLHSNGFCYPSILSSNYPIHNRQNNTLRYVWTDSGSDINYNNITISERQSYSLDIIQPTTSAIAEVNNGTNLSINFTLEKDGVNITSGVSLENVTIEGTKADIVHSVSDGIGVGPSVIDRPSYVGNPFTLIDISNPVTSDGTITEIKVWVQANMGSETQIGIFNGSGSTYSNRDCETIGSVTAGAERTYTVSLDAKAGDFIGIYYVSGDIELSTSGGVGVYRSGYLNDWCDGGDHTGWTAAANWVISLNGSSPSVSSSQFNYDSNSNLWQVNVTMPNKVDNDYDLFLNATYFGDTWSDVQANAIRYGAGASDSCTPTLNEDWIVEDDCVKESDVDLGTGSLHIITGGLVTMLDAALNSKNIYLNVSSGSRALWFNRTTAGVSGNLTG